MTFAYGAAKDLAERALTFAQDDDTRATLLGHLLEAERLRGNLGLALDAAARRTAREVMNMNDLGAGPVPA